MAQPRRNPGRNNRQNRQNRRNQPGRRGYPGQGTAGSMGNYANFPAPQEPAADFLPMTPQFEAGRRGLDDQYSSDKMNLINQQSMITPLYNQQTARLNTDQGFDTERLNEGLANRGIYSGGGGTNPTGASQQLYNRDIQVPYGRERSDLATAASAAQGQAATGLSNLDLGYNQGIAELLLNRASDAAANIPMNVPQYAAGPRILRGQRYNNKPNKPNKNNRRNNRGRK